MNVIWSPTAKRRVEEIVDYISADNVSAALNLIADIERQVRLLKNNPTLGRVASALDHENIREVVVHKNYIVVYELTKRNIFILTIRNSRQDADKQN